MHILGKKNCIRVAKYILYGERACNPPKHSMADIRIMNLAYRMLESDIRLVVLKNLKSNLYPSKFRPKSVRIGPIVGRGPVD